MEKHAASAGPVSVYGALAFALTLLTGTTGCVTQMWPIVPGNRPIASDEFPVLGVLADSQITTTNGFFVHNLRCKQAHLFVKVAMRTPAAEYLSPRMVEYFVKKLKADGAEMILYLGDGANSGCTDEVDALFAVLASQREQLGVPIFMAVGNHDYLGAGSTTEPRSRQLLCGTANPPLMKYEVLKRISAFNQASAQVSSGPLRFEYRDNFAALTNWFETAQDAHRMGCYLAGRLLVWRSEQPRPLELFLTDSSDYQDIELQPEFMGEQWGARGAISFASLRPQTRWYQQFEETNVVCRLIASHYPIKEFQHKLWGIIPVKERIGRPGHLLSTNTWNYWLSAHTHAPASKGTKTFKEKGGLFRRLFKRSNTQYTYLTCGSTIDKPQALLLYGAKADVQFKAIRPSPPADLEKSVLADVRSYRPETRPGWPDWASGEVVLGLTQHYSKPKWTALDTLNAYSCLDDFLARRRASHPEEDPLDVVAVLMTEAAIHE